MNESDRLSMVLSEEEAADFFEIGKLLTTEKDMSRLFEKIIQSSMKLTSSDSGAIYLVMESDTAKLSSVSGSDVKGKSLQSAIVWSNDGSIRMPYHPKLDITADKIAGYAVLTGKALRIDDIYKLDPAAGIIHDIESERKSGFLTKSVLCLPMKNRSENITGVILLVNKRRGKQTIPFTRLDEMLMNSLAGQAAAALENINLYRGLQDLLEEYIAQNRRLDELSRNILKAHEEERKRIAREIHDGPAQSAASLSFKLEIIRKLLESGQSENFSTEMDKLGRNIRAVVKEIRTIIYDLRPTLLDEGLKSAIEARLKTFAEDTGISTAFKSRGDDFGIEYYLSSTIYKVVQEALTNIHKHSQAKNVKIDLNILKESIKVTITDDGKGFDTNSIISARKPGFSERGFGMQGMKERVEIIHGTINFESSPGKGTAITIDIPFERK